MYYSEAGMYGRCILEKFNKRESCLSFGEEYCLFFFVNFNLQLTLQTTNNFCSLLLLLKSPNMQDTEARTAHMCTHVSAD